MENDMVPQNQMNAQGQAAAMAQIAMVREQMKIAKEFPRDFTEVHTKVMKACARKNIAEAAIWKYPRGGQQLSGPSIRLAEVLAMNYGNMDFGIRELSQRKGASVVESYCMDLETNVRVSKTFEVPHSVMKKGGEKKILTDQRDIYEHTANYGARRLRACILQCLPADLIEEATAKCKKTVIGQSDTPIEDKIKAMVTAFDTKFQISAEMLEKYLGYDLKNINDDGLFELRTIYQSLKDGQAKRGDFFKVKGEKPETAEGVKELDDALGEKTGEIVIQGENDVENVSVPEEKTTVSKEGGWKESPPKKEAAKKSKPKEPESESPMMKQFNDQLAKDSVKKE